MSYQYLAQHLHETADRARTYFAETYNAKRFLCEDAVEDDLPLRPTWQADLAGGCKLCVEVNESAFSPSLATFVTKCASRGMPVRLWVAVPAGGSSGKEVREARELGVGIVEVGDDGVHEVHRAVTLSLFGLRRIDLKKVPRKHRESLKKAGDAFLDGMPESGCQSVCQELEALTRLVAEHTYNKPDWWKDRANLNLAPRFFAVDSWAKMLETFDEKILPQKAQINGKPLNKALIAGARSHTDWRNSLSHKPKTLKALQTRDAKLRTMFEVTRDLVVEWYAVADAFRLKT